MAWPNLDVLLAAVPPLDSAFAVFCFYVMALLTLIWSKRHIDINRGQREPQLTEADAPPTADDLPPLTMLVAAKDEEANIGRCVDGLLAQDYPPLRVIAINDRSSDATGRILDERAAQDTRLRALHITELPQGWFGKNNAMRAGVEAADTEWLCFTDADCVFDSRKLIAAAVSYAQREQLTFLSVLPRLEAHTFWERVIQPVAGAVMIYWTPPQRVNSPDSPIAYANGAFMLLHRGAYDAIGGHDAVKATLNEDMHMARRAKTARVPFRVIRGVQLYRVRMYTGFRAIWRGWSRIFYGCFGTVPKLLASVLVLSLASVSPYVTLVLAPLAGANWGWLFGAAAAAIIAQMSVMWRFYRLSAIPGAWSSTYWLGAAVCVLILLSSLLKAFGAARTTWRGTTYARGA